MLSNASSRWILFYRKTKLKKVIDVVCNVVLISAVQQSDSVTRTHVCESPQSCPALCGPMDYSPPGSPIHGIMRSASHPFPLRFIPGESMQFPGLHSKALLFIHPVCKFAPVNPPVPPHPCPHPPVATTRLFSASVGLFLFYRWVPLHHILDSTSRGIMQYLSFSVWHTSLSMITSRSIHVVQMALFPSSYSWLVSTVCMDHIFLIHSSADGHLGCFHVLAVVNSASVNLHWSASVFLNCGFSPDLCLGAGLQNHVIALP